MIDTPTTNPTLTFDQQQQIDTTQKRLIVIESEITNATKVLRGTKMECDRAVKDLVYQEERLSVITIQVESAKKNLEELNDSCTQTKEKLSALESDIFTKSSIQSTKEQELKDREDRIKTAETDISNERAVIYHMGTKLDKETKEFNEKVAKLREVIITF